MKKWMYNAFIIIFIAVFVVSAGYLGSYFWESYVQERRYDDLSQLRPTANERPTLPQTDSTDGPEVIIPEPTVSEPETVEVTDPKTGQTRQILAEFAELYQMNSDIVGWMTIPGVNVDYPVMHTVDNPEYYLYRNFDKKKSSRGSLFIHWEGDVFEPSDNITIYGHRMRDDTMFGDLDKFRKKSFRDKYPYIYFDTLTEMHTYEIMAVFLTTATAKGFAYHEFVNAESPEDFDAFVKKCKKLALYDSGVDAQYGDKLICLSTCDYSRTNGRLVVVAKRIA